MRLLDLNPQWTFRLCWLFAAPAVLGASLVDGHLGMFGFGTAAMLWITAAILWARPDAYDRFFGNMPRPDGTGRRFAAFVLALIGVFALWGAIVAI